MKTRLAVIGAGPGGYVAAFHAADLGMQVTLIDADPNPGGVCTFRGCIPSKALLHAARVLDETKHATAYGVSFDNLSIDVDKLRAWKDQVVKKQTGGLLPRPMTAERESTMIRPDEATTTVTSGRLPTPEPSRHASC